MQTVPPVTEPSQPAPRPGIGMRGVAGVVVLLGALSGSARGRR